MTAETSCRNAAERYFEKKMTEARLKAEEAAARRRRLLVTAGVTVGIPAAGYAASRLLQNQRLSMISLVVLMGGIMYLLGKVKRDSRLSEGEKSSATAISLPGQMARVKDAFVAMATNVLCALDAAAEKMVCAYSTEKDGKRLCVLECCGKKIATLEYVVSSGLLFIGGKAPALPLSGGFGVDARVHDDGVLRVAVSTPGGVWEFRIPADIPGVSEATRILARTDLDVFEIPEVRAALERIEMFYVEALKDLTAGAVGKIAGEKR